MPPKQSPTYHPDSHDATLSRIMANLERQDKQYAKDQFEAVAGRQQIKQELASAAQVLDRRLSDIQTSLDKVAERVVVLEKDTWMRAGRAAAAVFIIGFLSWFLPWYFTSPRK